VFAEDLGDFGGEGDGALFPMGLDVPCQFHLT
jgi:hypothetical protein